MSEDNRAVGPEILLFPFLILFFLLRNYPVQTLIGAVVLGVILYNQTPVTPDKHQVAWTSSEEVWRVKGDRVVRDTTLGEHCLKIMADPTVTVERDIALGGKKVVEIRLQIRSTTESALDSFRICLKWNDATGTSRSVEEGVSNSPEEGGWQSVETTLELPLTVDSSILSFSFGASGQSCWIKDLQIGTR